MKKPFVILEDDGTLDTVVSINGCWHRYDMEFTAEYRNERGMFTRQGWIDFSEIVQEDHQDCEEKKNG